MLIAIKELTYLYCFLHEKLTYDILKQFIPYKYILLVLQFDNPENNKRNEMKIKWETGSNSTGEVRHEDCCYLKADWAILWIPAIPVIHPIWDFVSDR